MVKNCTKCGGLGPFGKKKGTPDGFNYQCKACKGAYQKAWADANPDKVHATRRTKPHVERLSARRRALIKIGWTLERFEEMWERQQGKCCLCGVLLVLQDSRNSRSATTACADHDHETGQPRGILCHLCNAGIGLLRDDPALIAKALAYLQSHRTDKAA
jgi:hypothetical protein